MEQGDLNILPCLQMQHSFGESGMESVAQYTPGRTTFFDVSNQFRFVQGPGLFSERMYSFKIQRIAADLKEVKK